MTTVYREFKLNRGRMVTEEDDSSIPQAETGASPQKGMISTLKA